MRPAIVSSALQAQALRYFQQMVGAIGFFGQGQFQDAVFVFCRRRRRVYILRL